MQIAGFWRRVFSTFINLVLIFVTLGIYLIFIIIGLFRGKPNIGMKATGLTWSERKPIRYILFTLLALLFNCIPFVGIIEIIRICLKKGRWAENWSGAYLVLASSVEQHPQYHINVKR